MKKEDLKVGMTIVNLGGAYREILAIGETSYFYKGPSITKLGSYFEDSDTFKNLTDFEPEKEKPELFWLWRVRNFNGSWHSSGYYMDEDGYETDGSYLCTWGKLTKHKIPGTAITADGESYDES